MITSTHIFWLRDDYRHLLARMNPVVIQAPNGTDFGEYSVALEPFCLDQRVTVTGDAHTDEVEITFASAPKRGRGLLAAELDESALRGLAPHLWTPELQLDRALDWLATESIHQQSRERFVRRQQGRGLIYVLPDSPSDIRAYGYRKPLVEVVDNPTPQHMTERVRLLREAIPEGAIVLNENLGEWGIAPAVAAEVAGT
jgi:hypothetical protein